MKLWLLRHARVVLPPGLCYGASDVPADEVLTAEAAQAIAPLLPAGLPVRVSDLRRAQQLHQALRAHRPDLGAAQTDPRIREMDFGTWEQTAWDAVPRTAFDDWMADFAQHRFGGAECVHELMTRVADALDETRAAVGQGGEALWITHAGVIRSVICVAQHGHQPLVSAAQWPREAPQPGEWMVLDV
ncbi:histidine phosphatase family protein [Hydrogenophaga pseudoflava]|uniref:histidine phosphatase family protein n=1 Tax=Hydrogenophaga pseudoflava TaxID=47421 RepID=UPI0027E4F8E9|nr:histidine phosphatase family protein [Hydrogenophaga pseudoflava]MDQ7744124.1 histidine phosphatase family protein [Hydrogenophaga pseudoflava]